MEETWTLIILWSNGFVTEFINIESLEACYQINTWLRQTIWIPELVQPHFACVPE